MKTTVLVTDDDPDVTQVLAVRLGQLGVKVVRSPDATHALVGIKRMRPKLVVLDVNMPGGNDMTVAKRCNRTLTFRGSRLSSLPDATTRRPSNAAAKWAHDTCPSLQTCGSGSSCCSANFGIGVPRLTVPIGNHGA